MANINSFHALDFKLEVERDSAAWDSYITTSCTAQAALGQGHARPCCSSQLLRSPNLLSWTSTPSTVSFTSLPETKARPNLTLQDLPLASVPWWVLNLCAADTHTQLTAGQVVWRLSFHSVTSRTARGGSPFRTCHSTVGRSMPTGQTKGMNPLSSRQEREGALPTPVKGRVGRKGSSKWTPKERLEGPPRDSTAHTSEPEKAAPKLSREKGEKGRPQT